MDWCRLWHDGPDDPKWRVIAKRSGPDVPPGNVWAVYTRMMVRASQSNPRGDIAGWDDEDHAEALGYPVSQVQKIREAMQGKVLDGDRLTGWDKRQPKRERPDDSSASRVREHRERQRQAAHDAPPHETPSEPVKRHVTPCNATKRLEESRLEEIRNNKEDTPPTSPPRGGVTRGHRIPDDWWPSDDDVAFAVDRGWTMDQIKEEAEGFVDYWRAEPGAKGRKLDWSRTWKNRIRDQGKRRRVNGQPMTARPTDRDREAEDRQAVAEVIKQRRARRHAANGYH